MHVWIIEVEKGQEWLPIEAVWTSSGDHKSRWRILDWQLTRKAAQRIVTALRKDGYEYRLRVSKYERKAR